MGLVRDRSSRSIPPLTRKSTAVHDGASVSRFGWPLIDDFDFQVFEKFQVLYRKQGAKGLSEPRQLPDLMNWFRRLSNLRIGGKIETNHNLVAGVLDLRSQAFKAATVADRFIQDVIEFFAMAAAHDHGTGGAFKFLRQPREWLAGRGSAFSMPRRQRDNSFPGADPDFDLRN